MGTSPQHQAAAGGPITHPLYLRAMGNLVRIVAAFPITDEADPAAHEPANAYMAANPGIGLLAIESGIAFLARADDRGVNPERLAEQLAAREAAADPMKPLRDFLESLDELGFDDPEAPVGGADTVDVVCFHLDALRTLAGSAS